MSRRIRLVIADDHPLILRGINEFMSTAADIEVVAACADGEQALGAIRKLKPDVAALDLVMPKLSGLQVLGAIKEESLATRVVFLTALIDRRDIMLGVAEGAVGFVLKESSPEDLLELVRAAASREMRRPQTWKERLFVGSEQTQIELDKILTEREWKLTAYVAAGLSNKEIASKLDITEGTVKVHLHNIFQKVGVSNRTALANFAHKYLSQTFP
jgi:DNA-binding NarL/FixJ family response regulator